MCTILATFHDPKRQRQDVALAVGTVSVASFLLYQAYVTISKNDDKEKKPLPRSPMGVFQTVRMLAGQSVPTQLLETAKYLGSWNFELNLPIPGHPKVAIISEADDIRDIFKDSLTYKPYAIYGQMIDVSPTKSPFIFTLPGDAEWHRRRKGTAPAFSQKHVRRMNDVAVKHTEMWLERFLTPLVDKNESFDVVEQMLKVILKAFCETAMEYDMSDEEIDSFIHEWDLVAKEFILKSATNPFRKYFASILPDRRRAAQASANNYKIAYSIIDNYRSLESPIEGTVIDLLMKNPTYKNDAELATEIFAYMVAGHDTTGITVAWALMDLAKNPKEQLALRTGLSKMSTDEWGRSELLKNIVRESMRLHPVASNTIARAIGRDMITKRGHFLPKGTLTFLPFYLTFHNDEIFEDAEAFRPSRWENPTESMKEAFIPFALGKQNCIGQSLANAESHCVLARMIQEFDFSIEDEGHAESSLVFKPVGLRAKATRVV